MNKQITLEQAVEKVQDGMTIMFGGFLGNGSATQIIDAIVEKGVKDLTIIANDTAYDEVAHGKLVTNHQVKKAIVSHTGTNKRPPCRRMRVPSSSSMCPRAPWPSASVRLVLDWAAC